jgi:hypothetical protein
MALYRAEEVPMDFARRAYVIRRFIQLQGLELLPLAALFLASFAHRIGALPLPGDDQPFMAGRWFMAGLAGVFAATLCSRRWYAKRYSVPGQRFTDSAAGPILLVVACLVVAGWLQQELRLPFSLPTLLLGTALAVVGVGDYPLRRHYLGAAAVLIGHAFSALLGVPTPVRSILFDGAIGVALAIVGIGDHLLIVTTLHDTRAFKEVPSDVRAY